MHLKSTHWRPCACSVPNLTQLPGLTGVRGFSVQTSASCASPCLGRDGVGSLRGLRYFPPHVSSQHRVPFLRLVHRCKELPSCCCLCDYGSFHKSVAVFAAENCSIIEAEAGISPSNPRPLQPEALFSDGITICDRLIVRQVGDDLESCLHKPSFVQSRAFTSLFGVALDYNECCNVNNVRFSPRPSWKCIAFKSHTSCHGSRVEHW